MMLRQGHRAPRLATGRHLPKSLSPKGSFKEDYEGFYKSRGSFKEDYEGFYKSTGSFKEDYEGFYKSGSL